MIAVISGLSAVILEVLVLPTLVLQKTPSSFLVAGVPPPFFGPNFFPLTGNRGLDVELGEP